MNTPIPTKDSVEVGTSSQMLLDRLAMVASVLCAAHCAFLAVLLTLLPALATLPVADHEFHLLLVWILTPLSVTAVLVGTLKHRDSLVLGGASLGLCIIIGAAFFGHDLLGEVGEKIATIIGSILLAATHYRNFRLCKKEKLEPSLVQIQR